MPDQIYTPIKDNSNQRAIIEREIKERDAILAQLKRQKQEVLDELTRTQALIKEHGMARRILYRQRHALSQSRMGLVLPK